MPWKAATTTLPPQSTAWGHPKTFVAAAAGERLYALFLVAVDSGARPGELFALTWADVDFTGGQIIINKSLEEIAGNLRI